jgi:hypothetical protein
LYHEGVLLAERHRYRDAAARWQRLIEVEPASEFARRARRELRAAWERDRAGASPAAPDFDGRRHPASADAAPAGAR